MIDNGTPRRPAGTGKGSRGVPKVRQLQGIQVRFVYEHHLVGEWFHVEQAFELPILSNEQYRVTGIQFRDREDL